MSVGSRATCVEFELVFARIPIKNNPVIFRVVAPSARRFFERAKRPRWTRNELLNVCDFEDPVRRSGNLRRRSVPFT